MPATPEQQRKDPTCKTLSGFRRAGAVPGVRRQPATPGCTVERLRRKASQQPDRWPASGGRVKMLFCGLRIAGSPPPAVQPRRSECERSFSLVRRNRESAKGRNREGVGLQRGVVTRVNRLRAFLLSCFRDLSRRGAGGGRLGRRCLGLGPGSRRRAFSNSCPTGTGRTSLAAAVPFTVKIGLFTSEQVLRFVTRLVTAAKNSRATSDVGRSCRAGPHIALRRVTLP